MCFQTAIISLPVCARVRACGSNHSRRRDAHRDWAKRKMTVIKEERVSVMSEHCRREVFLSPAKVPVCRWSECLFSQVSQQVVREAMAVKQALCECSWVIMTLWQVASHPERVHVRRAVKFMLNPFHQTIRLFVELVEGHPDLMNLLQHIIYNSYTQEIQELQKHGQSMREFAL